MISDAWSQRAPPLNGDIVGHIIAQFYNSPSYYPPEYSPRRDLLLISRIWYWSACKCLYRTICTEDFTGRAVELFTKTMLECPHLAKLVLIYVQTRVQDIVMPFRLFPNLVDVRVEDLRPRHIPMLAQTGSVTSLTSGTDFDECWVKLSRRCPLLNYLAFEDECPLFLQGAPLFPKLRTIKWPCCALSLRCYRPIQPHSLQTIVIDDLHQVDDAFIEHIFECQCESLERFEVRAISIVKLNAPLSLPRATNLQCLLLNAVSHATSESVLSRHLPSTLIHIEVDLPSLTPDMAQRNALEDR